MNEPKQFMKELRCAVCGQQGHGTWQETGPTSADLPHKLETLSDGFEIQSDVSGSRQIICKNCGTEQP